MPMLYLFVIFSRWWLGGFRKTLYHLSKILPWCQHFSSIPLDFCWHQIHFLPIWYSTMTSRYAFTVSIIFILGCFDTALWSSVPLSKTFVFLIDVRTNVCYNIFSATMNGRRLVLPIEDCDLWSQRNLLAEILMKGGLVLCWQLSCLFRSLACVLHALRLDTQ